MSTLVLERRQQRCLDDIVEDQGDLLVADAQCSNRTDAHGRLTLDDLITGVWEGLAVRDTVCCPACGGTMASCAAAPAGDRDGGCMDCGARLS